MHVAILIAALTLDQHVLRMFTEVLRRGDAGLMSTESAAFIVRQRDGDVQCVAWPRTYEVHAATYKGAAPEGTVAIVHTHPVEWPEPSQGDRAIARQLAIEVFSVTRSDIWEADPSGTVTARIRGRLWAERGSPSVCLHSVPATWRPATRRVCIEIVDADTPCDF